MIDISVTKKRKLFTGFDLRAAFGNVQGAKFGFEEQVVAEDRTR